jgi:hypothetical protein
MKVELDLDVITEGFLEEVTCKQRPIEVSNIIQKGFKQIN